MYTSTDDLFELVQLSDVPLDKELSKEVHAMLYHLWFCKDKHSIANFSHVEYMYVCMHTDSGAA